MTRPAPLAAAVTETVRRIAAGVKTWGIGVVTATAAGPPASVTITIRGQTIPGVHYLTSYTPVVTDKVLVLTGGQQLIVLGKITT